MDKVELKFFVDYIKDLEERLLDEDYDHISMQTELPYLNQAIQLFMDATFTSKNKYEKELLAILEMHARKCKDFIEKTLAVKN